MAIFFVFRGTNDCAIYPVALRHLPRVVRCPKHLYCRVVVWPIAVESLVDSSSLEVFNMEVLSDIGLDIHMIAGHMGTHTILFSPLSTVCLLRSTN